MRQRLLMYLQVTAALLPGSLRAQAPERWLVLPAVPASAIRSDTGRTFQKIDTLTLRYDLYRPARAVGAAPLVVIYNGFTSNTIRQTPQMRDWAKLLASRGMAAVAYDSRPGGTVTDYLALRAHLTANAAALHLDTQAVALLSWSGHAFRAYDIVVDPTRNDLAAAAFLYGAGPSSFPPRLDRPMLFVRAGLDEVRLNRTIDSLAGTALARNAPVTVINLPGSTHGFDGFDDNDLSRHEILDIADWLKAELSANQRVARASLLPAARASGALFTGDWPAAVSGYEALVRKDSSNSTLRIRLGHAFTGAGEYARALEQYQRAVDLGDGRLRDIANGAVVAAAGLRNYERALPWLQLLLQRGFAGKMLWEDSRLAVFRLDDRFRALTGQ